MSSSISSFFSSFLPVVHADTEEKQEKEESFKAKSNEGGDKADQATEEPEAEAEEEEEEPEDELPAIREDCKASAKCAALTKHFEHCQEKVQGGEGFKGEDCVEELMMHCVDDCAGPKLFSKLR